MDNPLERCASYGQVPTCNNPDVEECPLVKSLRSQAKVGGDPKPGSHNQDQIQGPIWSEDRWQKYVNRTRERALEHKGPVDKIEQIAKRITAEKKARGELT